MFFILLWQLLAVLTASATSPTQTTKRNNNGPASQFVTVQDGQFFVNGSAFRFIGTNAYWLHTLNTEEDIDYTLGNISEAGFTVVRTWAFNDVETIPENGTWFQLISNGTLTINDGLNGLPKLDKVIELAKKHGLYLLLSLTNNWSPIPGIDVPADVPSRLESREFDQQQTENRTSIRNSLSHDYGGMDIYVRNLGDIHEHDQFYINQTIIDAFKNYTSQIASRYANQSNVFGWELANDPRCNSTLPATSNCKTTTVTLWHSELAQHVKTVDPNHLVSSGNQGYFCADCPKLFPRVIPPPPEASPAPESRRRRSLSEPLSRAKLLKERKAAWKQERERKKRSGEHADGVKIRGRWMSTNARRQEDLEVGSAFDGSHGVDSEDIINIPAIGFGSFQLFPDQYQYGPVDTSLPPFNQTLQIGLDWIRRHADAARLFGKPISLTGFGLVTQNNSESFVPFNGTLAPFGSDQANTTQAFHVTDEERNEAYRQWIEASREGGLQGVIQYQWSQGNLTAQEGSTIAPLPDESGTTPNEDSTGESPNDGYGILGQGQAQVIDTIKSASQEFAPDST